MENERHDMKRIAKSSSSLTSFRVVSRPAVVLSSGAARAVATVGLTFSASGPGAFGKQRRSFAHAFVEPFRFEVREANGPLGNLLAGFFSCHAKRPRKFKQFLPKGRCVFISR